MRRPPRLRTVATAAAAAGILLGGLMAAGTATAAGNSSNRHVVSPVPGWTSHAQHVPSIQATQAIQAKVWLAPRNGPALTSLVQAVSDPSSKQYGKYLTADQYRATYAPDAAEVATVKAWLTRAGLTIESVGADNHFIAVSGSTAAMNTAFGANVQHFKVKGKSVLGPTSAVTVPASIGAGVLAVTGLDTLGHIVHTNTTSGAPAVSDPPPAPGFVNAGPCSSYYGEKTDSTDPKFQGQHLPYAVCGYVPSQLRDAYGVTATQLTGRGVTVAITDAFDSPTLKKDANTYATNHGDSAFSGKQFTDRSLPITDEQKVADCGGNSWYGEQSLDVEAVHGIAPKANVAYYGAASCYDDDLLAAMALAVNDTKASMVTNSWGEPTYVLMDDGTIQPVIDDALVSAYESVFLQGASQGVGFYFSAGDDGDELASYGVKQTDWPASDPYVTTVGGTALAVNQNGNRQFETGWGTQKYTLDPAGSWTGPTWLYGSGGGYSAWFGPRRPWYQRGVAKGGPGRAVPDIAMVADPTTGMLVGQTQDFALETTFGQGTQYGEYRIGGTSLASPLMAGLNADAQQGGNRIGFANPLIYSLAKRGVYFDVTPQGDPGNVRVDYINGLNDAAGTRATVRTFDHDSSLKTARGWDTVTGVGTPTAKYLRTLQRH